MTPEGKVKRKVSAALKSLGAEVWKFMPVQSGFGTVALDYLLCIRGRFVAIETKAPGKSLTPLQEGTKAAMEAAGGIVLVVWDEPSLAIAMKIILALEFAPHATTWSYAHPAACLAATRTSYTGAYKAERIHQEAKRTGEQYRGNGYASQAIDAADGRYNGAPGVTPQRRA